jgi:uncharacterized protein YfbU (UPF0304 family)
LDFSNLRNKSSIMVVRKSFLGFSITEIVSVITITGMLIAFLINTTSRVTACEVNNNSINARQCYIEKRQDKIDEKLDKMLDLLASKIK